MTKFKRHSAAISLGISLIILFLALTGVYLMRNNNILYLKDLQGERSVLSDFIVTGYFEDNSHAQKFNITNGKLKSNFLYYNNVNDIRSFYTKDKDPREDDKYRYWNTYNYDISKDANINVEYSEKKTQEDYGEGKIDVVKKKVTTYSDTADVIMCIHRAFLENYVTTGYLEFKSNVYIKSDKKDLEFVNETTYSQSFGSSEYDHFVQKHEYSKYGYDIAVTESQQYFTILTDKRYKGENGIYKVERYENWFSFPEDSRNFNGCVKPITTFSLDENEINVLGLHYVNNKLVLILTVDDILTFRVYEPQTGALVDELAVNQIKLANEEVSYDPYINDNTLSLNIITQKEDINMLKVVSARIEDKITLLHCVDNLTFDKATIDYVPCIVPINGKLIVITTLKDSDNTLNVNLYNKLYLLFVFDDVLNDNNLLYKGQIITDVNEDIFCYQNRLYERNVINYNKIRTLTNIEVKEK